ncbi:hypothetical protein KIN20_025929 [Parelaphostrongylus tenuis]|uniref:Uncharacterized protein n=1 Tax=Parelaphostrongylus tenuis TaxID=148309 RepID=A0AAD5QX85_PARTN|nr:hypothetical protein KIN20_025929 [Parelaphostrongylus tenuis]
MCFHRMEHPTPLYSRRMSLESTTTSEFEVISRHGSSCGNTVRGSESESESASHQRLSPSDSISMPPPYSEFDRDELESPLHSNVGSTSTSLSNELISMSHSTTLTSDSSFSEKGMTSKETARTNKQKTPGGDDEWRMKIDQLLERNSMLENLLISSKSRENQLAEEIEQLRQQNTELTEQIQRLQYLPAKDSSTSWYLRLVAVAVIVAVLALYIICYAQLLNERRNSEGLKNILERMGDIVEKLEGKHRSEYEQLLEETTKQIADDMNVTISLARKERELEHERLIEAYREKMLLYNDLDELRKKKSHKRRSSFDF